MMSSSSGGEGGGRGGKNALGSPPPPPVDIGFPQPTPPCCCPQGYQSVPPSGHVAEGPTPANGIVTEEPRLPFWGIGAGWFLFIIGFFLGSIPWYAGALIFHFSAVDHREKPGYVACTIAAVISAIAAILGITKGAGQG